MDLTMMPRLFCARFGELEARARHPRRADVRWSILRAPAQLRHSLLIRLVPVVRRGKRPDLVRDFAVQADRHARPDFRRQRVRRQLGLPPLGVQEGDLNQLKL